MIRRRIVGTRSSSGRNSPAAVPVALENLAPACIVTMHRAHQDRASTAPPSSSPANSRRRNRPTTVAHRARNPLAEKLYRFQRRPDWPPTPLGTPDGSRRPLGRGWRDFKFYWGVTSGVTPPSRHRPYERGVRPRAPMKKEERVAGIEPAWPAWKAGTLPLSYTRETSAELCAEVLCRQRLSSRLSNLWQQVHADGAIKREISSPGDQQ